MKISYLVTCNTETDTLKRLIKLIYSHLNTDELVILQDEGNWDTKRKHYLCDITELNKNSENIVSIPIFVHPLNNDYGAHKNFGNEKCTGDFIFQIDGDELPPTTLLGDNLKVIIQSNPAVELIYVPRINDFKGVTEEHAKQWGWRLTPSPFCDNRPIVNWCDFQSRIYKNDPERIKWDLKLHEKIVGHKEYSFLPAEEEYALYHDKTIEKQIETNKKYNKVFTEAENRGHKII